MSDKSSIERYRYLLYGCSFVLGVAFVLGFDSLPFFLFPTSLVIFLVCSIALSIMKVNSTKNKVLLNALRTVFWTGFLLQVIILVVLLGAIGGAP